MTKDIDLIEVVAGLQPAMHEITRTGWNQVGLVVLAVVVMSALAFLQGLEFFLPIPIGLLLLVGFFLVQRSTKRKHENLLMSRVASAMKFTFTKDMDESQFRLPPRMLPAAVIKKSQDLITGTFDDRRIRMAKFERKTRGKHFNTLFNGFVVEVANIRPLPVFFIAPLKETDRRFFSATRIHTNGLIALDRDRARLSMNFGLWTTLRNRGNQQPMLPKIINAFVDIDECFEKRVKVFSVMSDGEKTFIAVQNKRDLFSIGGLFVRHASVLERVKGVVHDFRIPLRLIEIVAAAEQAASETEKAPHDL